MIKYWDNKDNIIQCAEIDLTEIHIANRMEMLRKFASNPKNTNIFKFKSENRLAYKTEILIPKPLANRISVLFVLGNPAIHSVEAGMFFSYENTRTGKWKEHRFWRALRDIGVLSFAEDTRNPAPENIEEINKVKSNSLLNVTYDGKFNIFILPYFSFPTPSSGRYSGVEGIKKLFGRDIFEKIKKDEFNRYKEILLKDNIKEIICFQKEALNCIKDNGSNTVHEAGPTRLIHTNKGKQKLKEIFSDIMKRHSNIV